MTDKEKSKELTRSSFAAQMAMLGYEPNGNPKDTVEVVRCKYCKHGRMINILNYTCTESKNHCEHILHSPDWFCADGRKKDD